MIIIIKTKKKKTSTLETVCAIVFNIMLFISVIGYIHGAINTIASIQLRILCISLYVIFAIIISVPIKKNKL